jgi:hypothetical protein
MASCASVEISNPKIFFILAPHSANQFSYFTWQEKIDAAGRSGVLMKEIINKIYTYEGEHEACNRKPGQFPGARYDWAAVVFSLIFN